MMEDKPETCQRIRKKYRGNNIYIVLSDKSLTLSMVDNDFSQRTIAGLDAIALLTTKLLEHGVDMDEIKKDCFLPASRSRKDVPGILIEVLP